VSATGRDAGGGYAREPDDFYRTPAWAVRAIHPWLPRPHEHLAVVDAGAGDGAIADALPYGKRVECVELNARRAAACLAKGYGVHEMPFERFRQQESDDGFDVVVMNPPYSDAMQFVQDAFELVRNANSGQGGCVFALLRLPWLASQDRAAFHRRRPAHVLVLPRRPEFCMACSCGAKPKCGWGEVRATGEERPKRCGKCAGPVKVSTTDATDYAWFGWGNNRDALRKLHAGAWEILDIERKEKR
jgi:predicted RNA methylase